MDSNINLEIRGDRMWTSAMKYREDVHAVSKKLERGERMNDMT